MAMTLALRVEALTLSKPALMSRKREDTFNPGLWRTFTSGVRARQASEELSPGREPQWLRWTRPLNLAMAESLTFITRLWILEMVLRSTIMQKEARKLEKAFPALSIPTPFAVFSDRRWQPNATTWQRSSTMIVGLIRLIPSHTE